MIRILALLCGTIALCAADRPNFIWIVGEDLGPELGCYGDGYASTPHLDRLASEGARFTRAFTHAPVCAPSRSGLITGQYPTKIGSHHMRSKVLRPPPAFTTHLRNAGYHVAWPGKTDFNFDVPGDYFDTTRNWVTNGIPRKPFFAYINFGESHESQIRMPRDRFTNVTSVLGSNQRHDPAQGDLPPYYPDTPAVRQDWASYYDLVSVVDRRVGDLMRKLEEQGLLENTVIVFFGDHGRGLPRGKRWVYDSGIRVPLMVRWPGQIKPGTVRDDLVSFVDLGPTMLALAGVEVPTEMDGHVFLGPKARPRRYIYAARDRMDETYDRIRAVRDSRFKYIRNYHPELPYAQRVSYMEEMPTMREWRRLHSEDKLTGAQKLFFADRKPVEELYDTEVDPHEIRNLIDDPNHREKLGELRGALDEWIRRTRDLGQIPERELIQRGLVADKLAEYEPRKEPGFRSP